MNKVRLRYSKTSRAKYISHLDLSATMRRALIRAGISLKYSEGFNPHPYMSVALPLSVGAESICELMDIGIADVIGLEDLPRRITACLPEGLEVTDAYYPVRKFSDIAWVEVSGTLCYDKAVPPSAATGLFERYSMPCIEVLKKTKRGVKTIDISGHIRDFEFSDAETVNMRVKLSAGDPLINPDNVMDALKGQYEELSPDYAFFKRLEVYDGDLKVFR